MKDECLIGAEQSMYRRALPVCKSESLTKKDSGTGTAFDSIVSGAAYGYYLKKKSIL